MSLQSDPLFLTRRVFFKTLFHVCCIVLLNGLIPQIVSAELSVINKWRIEQSIKRCENTGNAIRYSDYWQDSASKEGDEVVCMAEHVADFIVDEGDEWLEKKALELITSCKTQAPKDMSKYFICLQKNLENTAGILSRPCRDFGKEELWETKQCSRLVTYLFMKKFEVILEENKPQIKKIHASIDKIKDVKVVRTVFNPVIAIIFFYVLTLTVVFIFDRGNWMKISKWGMVTGPFIVVSCFFKGGWRFFLAGIGIVVLLLFFAWNRRKAILKFFKKIRSKISI